LPRYYANITLDGPAAAEIARFLTSRRIVAYVAAAPKSKTVVFHEDLGAQEQTAGALSTHFRCPALLVMDYGGTVLLYHLYVGGEQADAYVSRPHDELEAGAESLPEGNAAVLSAAFGMEHRTASVERILRRPTHPTKGYELAVNRHGELARALGLPQFAAGIGFRDIAVGELPAGQGFDPATLLRTGG
jgi:hypothetical protein